MKAEGDWSEQKKPAALLTVRPVCGLCLLHWRNAQLMAMGCHEAADPRQDVLTTGGSPNGSHFCRLGQLMEPHHVFEWHAGFVEHSWCKRGADFLTGLSLRHGTLLKCEGHGAPYGPVKTIHRGRRASHESSTRRFLIDQWSVRLDNALWGQHSARFQWMRPDAGRIKLMLPGEQRMSQGQTGFQYKPHCDTWQAVLEPIHPCMHSAWPCKQRRRHI